MNEIQQAAYIISQAACAQIEAFAMMAHNQTMPENHLNKYSYNEFMELINKYGIHQCNINYVSG